ncbi:hypothetical protein [Pedobacter gandavensis]|uniref:hypothetical protein n=1 Tax=Pedobacter gandavensis TaxID=2679963 RepID=UPI00292D0EA1|nr:hypothetical protein [Pedobacter gandavensis]
MKKLRQYSVAILVAVIALTFNACKKDPKPEVVEEVAGKSELSFLEVEREAHGDHFHYNPIASAKPLVITFDSKGMAAAGTHAHLQEGKTYKLSLRSFDVANNELQQGFLDQQDQYQAFILGGPTGVLTYAYGDRDKSNKKINVGVTGYLTVDKAAAGFTFQYVLRHLNPGVKSGITGADWNNPDFSVKFSGSNKLDLKFELHPVEADGHDH